MGILDALASLFLPAQAWADTDTTLSGIGAVTSGLQTAASNMGNDALTAIGNVIPVVAPIMAAIVVITIVYRVIKKFSK